MKRQDKYEMPHLSKLEALILELLLGAAGQEMFGLELVKSSGGRITRGSVYVLLSRIQEKGFVTSRREPAPEHEGGLPRVLYKPTGVGQRAYYAWSAAKYAWGLSFSAEVG